MHQESFNEKFRRRTKMLSLDVIRTMSSLRYTDATSILRKQIIRSSTSVASNFRAVCRARSDNERFAKICIVVEEADETLFWIEMLKDAEIIEADSTNKIEQEATEILKVMSSYKRSLKTKNTYST